MKGSEYKFVKYMEGSDKRFVIPVYQRNYDWKTENCMQLYDAICCLEIINIRLDMEDNPQLIFERLNSTGLDLSEGDKIRNFILMGLPSKEQNEYYEKYWNRIEVCTKQDAFTKSVEISDGIYVWTHTSTQSKLSVLNRLFKLYDEDPADLVFFLRDESELSIDEPGSRYELRRRYWTYALPLIKEAHGKDGSFSNVSPGRENWINGFFGISGFSICCVANYDAARVEIVFQKGEKEENKKAFDALISHRLEIESVYCLQRQLLIGELISAASAAFSLV